MYIEFHAHEVRLMVESFYSREQSLLEHFKERENASKIGAYYFKFNLIEQTAEKFKFLLSGKYDLINKKTKKVYYINPEYNTVSEVPQYNPGFECEERTVYLTDSELSALSYKFPFEE